MKLSVMFSVLFKSDMTYDSTRHNECPPTGSWIGLDGLEHRHVMFDLLSIDGARPVVVDLLPTIGRAAIGGRLRLHLHRSRRLLLNLVIHVEQFLVRNVRDEENGWKKREKIDWARRPLIPTPRSRWTITVPSQCSEACSRRALHRLASPVINPGTTVTSSGLKRWLPMTWDKLSGKPSLHR